MDDCCEVPSQAPTAGTVGPAHCPNCGKAGKIVAIETVKALLTPAAMRRLDAAKAYSFCPTRECATVYFSGPLNFNQQDLRVPVFQKNSDAAMPVCYCFGFVRDDFKAPGAAIEIMKQVSAFVKAGVCACELRNPQGSCCLGNISTLATK